MPRFQYRRLRVRLWDKHHDGRRKRGGDEPDRILMVNDSDQPDQINFTDERGDDGEGFRNRSEEAFLAYLNELGADGWQLIDFRDVTPITSYPVGNYLLMRAE